MAKTLEEKKTLLESYKTSIANSKGIIVLKPNSVTPNEINRIKIDLVNTGSTYRVIKNTIFKIALNESGFQSEESLDFGEHAVIYIADDVVNTSKQVKIFTETLKDSKKNQKVSIISGYYEKTKLTKEQVLELAEMPSKEGSISMILGVLENALSSVVNVLEDAPRSIVTILDLAFEKN